MLDSSWPPQGRLRVLAATCQCSERCSPCCCYRPAHEPPGDIRRPYRLDALLAGDGPAAVEHLLAQAEVYAPEAEELLDLIGVGEGASVIDVGCGALGILPLLRARVGERGRVVGPDLEPRLLAFATELAGGRGLRVEAVQADATRTDLPSGSFDLVHARALLLNLTDPERAVAEMVRLARSGGTVALQEPDAAGWVCDPPHPAFERLCAELLAVYPRTGKDFEIGRRTARLLRGAGLRDVHVRATARITRPGDYYHTFLLTLCALLRDELLAGHTLTPDQLDSYSAELSEHLSRSHTITCQPLLWAGMGREILTDSERALPSTPPAPGRAELSRGSPSRA